MNGSFMSTSATEAAGKKCAGSVYCSPLYSSCNELFQLADLTKVMTFYSLTKVSGCTFA